MQQELRAGGWAWKAGAMCIEAHPCGLQDGDCPGIDLYSTFTPKLPIAKTVAVVHTAGQWVGRCYTWVSPVHMALLQGMKPGDAYGPYDRFTICALCTTEVEPLPQVAARRAFGNIDLRTLRRLANIWSLTTVPTRGELYDTVEAMVKELLPDIDAQEVHKIMAQRLYHLNASDANLLDIPEMGEQMDAEDRQQIQDAERQQQSRRDNLKPYKRTWVAKRRVFAGESDHGGAKVWVQPPVCLLAQAEVRPMMPPGTFIWRDNTGGAWQMHAPPPTTGHSVGQNTGAMKQLERQSAAHGAFTAQALTWSCRRVQSQDCSE